MRAEPTKKLIIAMVLMAQPALLSPVVAQTKLTPRNVTTRTDNCAPIGRTANGMLVYSMKCDNLPAPPPPPPQAEAPAAAAPEAAEDQGHRTGFFGMSYEGKRPDQ